MKAATLKTAFNSLLATAALATAAAGAGAQGVVNVNGMPVFPNNINFANRGLANFFTNRFNAVNSAFTNGVVNMGNPNTTFVNAFNRGQGYVYPYQLGTATPATGAANPFVSNVAVNGPLTQARNLNGALLFYSPSQNLLLPAAPGNNVLMQPNFGNSGLGTVYTANPFAGMANTLGGQLYVTSAPNLLFAPQGTNGAGLYLSSPGVVSPLMNGTGARSFLRR